MVYGSQYPQPVNTHWDNFEPRIGLAYTIDSKTVFRAGFVKANTVGTQALAGERWREGKNGYNPPSAIASAVTGVPAFYWPNVPAPAYLTRY